VAEEVGKLAASSAESTQEIALLVQQAVAEARRAVETVQQVSADMEQIELGASEADGMMQRISAALEQQSSAVQSINQNMASLNQIAESNASASEEITATVIELSAVPGLRPGFPGRLQSAETFRFFISVDQVCVSRWMKFANSCAEPVTGSTP